MEQEKQEEVLDDKREQEIQKLYHKAKVLQKGYFYGRIVNTAYVIGFVALLVSFSIIVLKDIDTNLYANIAVLGITCVAFYLSLVARRASRKVFNGEEDISVLRTSALTQLFVIGLQLGATILMFA